MPGLFIDVRVSAAHVRDAALAKKLEEACPVDIFEASDAGVRIAEENLDECTLCDLCIQAAPPATVEIVKLYAKG
jgi:NAD-dependent dihydropyrimidine dehydrogenase PreA subunit